MYMEEQDLHDLAAFISTSLIDSGALLDADNNSAGDAMNGEELYGNVCTNCHGPEGNAINFHPPDDPEFLGHLAAGNPWEFVHKVRYGQPGWPMPSAIANEWSDQDVADILAYAESFPTEAVESSGGQLYDKWWVVAGADEPTEDQALWATQDNNTRSGKDTWRCKECHGWDYQGVDGAYSSGSHMTGFAGVLGTTADVSMFDGSNADHDFSAMGDFYMEAMVTFMNEEMSDIGDYVNDDKTVNGDPSFGADLFEGTFGTGLTGGGSDSGARDATCGGRWPLARIIR